jgi:hypothetical protein
LGFYDYFAKFALVGAEGNNLLAVLSMRFYMIIRKDATTKARRAVKITGRGDNPCKGGYLI